jgi:DNA polymerase-3 subunit alpha
LSEAQIAQRDRASGQTSLFDMCDVEEAAQVIHAKPDVPEWPEHELLQFEKEMLGLYVSSHPLAQHSDTLRRFCTVRLADLAEKREGEEVVVGGIITNVKTHITGKGNKMAFLTVDTLEGACEVTVFSDLYEAKSGLLLPDTILLIPAKVNYRNSEPSLLANALIPIDEAEKQLARAVHIRIETVGRTDEQIERLAEVLGEHRGTCDVYLHCVTPEAGEVTVHASVACRVTASRPLRVAVEELLGPDTYWCSAGMGLPSHAAPKVAAPEQPRWKKRRDAAMN